MRIAVLCTIFGFGLCACHKTTTFLNADNLTRVTSGVPESTPCNDVQQQGAEVDLVGSHAAAPTPAGGTIEDGTYVLTSSTLYTKDRAHGSKLVEMGKTTMLVNGSTSQLVRSTTDGRERRTTVNRVSSGTVATLHTTCASPSATGSDGTSTTKYTATRESFQFISDGPAGTVVATYKKL
jgi:hypothetical protein